MVRHAALVLCNSEAERTLVTRDFGSDLSTKVVLPGIDEAWAFNAEPATSLAGDVVLTGGRLEPYKQVDRVVQSISDLPSTYRLVVFGEGPDLERIVATAAECGVADRVEVAGRMADDALNEAFRTASVFVSLSRQEAFGLTVLEAAAVGTPVVCSDIPAYREVSGLLPAGAITLLDVDVAPRAVADAIAAAAAAPRPEAPSLSLLPTWSTMAAGILDGYRSVLVSRGRSIAAPRPATPYPRRIHVAGGSGTGKTTIAERLGTLAGLPVFHLDDIARDPATGRIRAQAERMAMVAAITAQPRWVTEGIHVGWTDELVGHADTILSLDHASRPTGRAAGRASLRRRVAESRRSRGLRRFGPPAISATSGHSGRDPRNSRVRPGPARHDRRGCREPRGHRDLARRPCRQVVHCLSQADVDAFDGRRRVAGRRRSDESGT